MSDWQYDQPRRAGIYWYQANPGTPVVRVSLEYDREARLWYWVEVDRDLNVIPGLGQKLARLADPGRWSRSGDEPDTSAPWQETRVDVLAITGGRFDRHGRVLIPSEEQIVSFVALVEQLQSHTIVHGGAVGTDTFVDRFVRDLINTPGGNFPVRDVIAYPIHSVKDGQIPQLRGSRRNGRMLVSSKAQGLCAFPGGNGTADCIGQALRLGLRVWCWEETNAGIGGFPRL